MVRGNYVAKRVLSSAVLIIGIEIYIQTFPQPIESH